EERCRPGAPLGPNLPQTLGEDSSGGGIPTLQVRLTHHDQRGRIGGVHLERVSELDHRRRVSPAQLEKMSDPSGCHGRIRIESARPLEVRQRLAYRARVKEKATVLNLDVDLVRAGG